MNIASIATNGYTQAIRRFDASAQRLARVGEPAANVDLPTEAIEQMSASHAVKANIATLQAADEMFRKILDIKV